MQQFLTKIGTFLDDPYSFLSQLRIFIDFQQNFRPFKEKKTFLRCYTPKKNSKISTFFAQKSDLAQKRIKVKKIYIANISQKISLITRRKKVKFSRQQNF